MSLAIVYCPQDIQDVPLNLANESNWVTYLVVFDREQFDDLVNNPNLRDDVEFVNDPREA